MVGSIFCSSSHSTGVRLRSNVSSPVVKQPVGHCSSLISDVLALPV